MIEVLNSKLSKDSIIFLLHKLGSIGWKLLQHLPLVRCVHPHKSLVQDYIILALRCKEGIGQEDRDGRGERMLKHYVQTACITICFEATEPIMIGLDAGWGDIDNMRIPYCFLPGRRIRKHGIDQFGQDVATDTRANGAIAKTIQKAVERLRARDRLTISRICLPSGVHTPPRAQ